MTEKQHKNGISWDEAPIPKRWHLCWPQTTGKVVAGGVTVERCPCGAVRLGGGAWLEKNTRRGSS